jgi:hypothetical protein
MKTIVTYIVAILATLVAVYFSMEQTQKFQELQVVRLKHIDDTANTSASADGTEKKLKNEKEALTLKENNRTEVRGSIEVLKLTEAEYNRDMKKPEGFLVKIQENETALAAVSQELEKLTKQLAVEVDVNDTDRAVTQVEEQKQNRVRKGEELDVLIVAAEKVLTTNTAERDRLVQREDTRIAKLQQTAMEAVITGVNQDWGFLVIGAGTNSGFTPQSALIVQRNGKMIGRARPSSIEPTQTIAEINFDSIAPGVRIQPGDKVVYETPSSN